MGPDSLFQWPFANLSFRRYILVIWKQKDPWATLEKRYASHQLTMNQNMSVTTVLYAKKQTLSSAEKSPKCSPFPWQDDRLLAPICCMWIKKFTWLSVITSQRTEPWKATSWHRRRLNDIADEEHLRPSTWSWSSDVKWWSSLCQWGIQNVIWELDTL